MSTRKQSADANSAMIMAWSLFALLLIAASHGRNSCTGARNPPMVPAVPALPNPTHENQVSEIRPLWQLEKTAIIEAIERLKGDKLLAAEKLGIGKTTLYRKLKKYGIALEHTVQVREVKREV